jgi:hypothetical protein
MLHATHETRYQTVSGQVHVNAREIVDVAPDKRRCTLADGFDHTHTYDIYPGQLLVTFPNGDTFVWHREDFDRWYSPLPNQRTAWV